MCNCSTNCSCNNSTTLPIGPQGTPGTNGTNGSNGVDGIFGGYSSNWKYSTSTSSGPAATEIRFNNATPSLVSAIYISKTNYDSLDLSAFVDTFDDTGLFGYIRIFKYNDNTKYRLFKLTNVTTNPSDYSLTVTYIGSNGTYSANDQLVLSFTPMSSGIKFTTLEFNDSTNPFYSINGSTTNTPVGSFIFPGSTSVGSISAIYANIWTSSGATSVSVRVRDVTNSQTIASGSTTATSVTTILDLGAISNIPTNPSKFEIQVTCPDAGQSVKIASVMIGVF